MRLCPTDFVPRPRLLSENATTIRMPSRGVSKSGDESQNVEKGIHGRTKVQTQNTDAKDEAMTRWSEEEPVRRG